MREPAIDIWHRTRSPPPTLLTPPIIAAEWPTIARLAAERVNAHEYASGRESQRCQARRIPFMEHVARLLALLPLHGRPSLRTRIKPLAVHGIGRDRGQLAAEYFVVQCLDAAGWQLLALDRTSSALPERLPPISPS